MSEDQSNFWTLKPTPYELLGINETATEQQIKTAYRKLSLLYHPDKNRDDPKTAGMKFHELKQAYDQLLNTSGRQTAKTKDAADAARQAAQARTKHDADVARYMTRARDKAREVKRKEMIADLKRREAEAAENQRKKEQEKEMFRVQGIKDQNRALMEKKRREQRDWEERLHGMRLDAPGDVHESSSLDTGRPEFKFAGLLNTIVRLRFGIKTRPDLGTPESIARVLNPFGDIDEELIFLKKKSRGYCIALVPFRRVECALAAIRASGRSDLGLGGVEISWVEEDREDSHHSQRHTTDAFTAQKASNSKGVDPEYEAMTLARMRQAHKARVACGIIEDSASHLHKSGLCTTFPLNYKPKMNYDLVQKKIEKERLEREILAREMEYR
ncbi:hypothetical protein BDQ17DRAFT_1542220 [Cyathus striatus]|nr:hypothetical protein BDQ17DRAFT_1542220 [Cyathus striatus]